MATIIRLHFIGLEDELMAAGQRIPVFIFFYSDSSYETVTSLCLALRLCIACLIYDSESGSQTLLALNSMFCVLRQGST